mmetsp:Transcript_70384/g.204097  ORF Transcript_70384/g.204097 Transcript_70384/m.204097 type:complete len:497 (-) Transcript_70384:89-1579(-)
MLSDPLLAMESCENSIYTISTQDTLPSSMALSSSSSESSHDGFRGGGLRAKHVAAIAFALTSAGPFGIESCVRTAGPAWCLVGLLCTFVFYTFPEILMTSELMMVSPVCNGGVVYWVKRGLGKPAAAFVSLNMVAYAVLGLATYPTLAARYFKDIDEGYTWLTPVVCYGVVLLGFVVNLFNLEFATSVYMVMLVAILVPFAIGLGLSWGTWHVAVDAIIATRERGAGLTAENVNLLISTMLWLNTGWDALGGLAKEVSSPRALVVGLSSSAVAGLAAYVVCMFGALAAGPGPWNDGYLAVAYGRFWEPLEPIIVVMGAVSNFLLFASSLSCVSRLIQAMADPELGLQLLPSFLAQRMPGSGAPATALFAISALELLLVSGFDFEYLLQVSTLLHVFVFWATLASFTQLRFRQQGVERLWGVPGGRWGAAAVLCARVPVLTLLCACACAVPSVLIGALAFNFLFLFLAVGWAWHRGGLSMSALRELDSDALAALGTA